MKLLAVANSHIPERSRSKDRRWSWIWISLHAYRSLFIAMLDSRTVVLLNWVKVFSSEWNKQVIAYWDFTIPTSFKCILYPTQYFSKFASENQSFLLLNAHRLDKQADSIPATAKFSLSRIQNSGNLWFLRPHFEWCLTEQWFVSWPESQAEFCWRIGQTASWLFVLHSYLYVPELR
jgi:hypothetical protein